MRNVYNIYRPSQLLNSIEYYIIFIEYFQCTFVYFFVYFQDILYNESIFLIVLMYMSYVLKEVFT